MNNHPAHTFEAIIPDDGADLPNGACRAIYVGTGGNVSIYAKGSTTAVVFKNLAAGATLPAVATRVLVTNTTADDLIALY